MAVRIFRHYVSLTLLLVTLGEFLIFMLSVYAAIFFRFGGFDEVYLDASNLTGGASDIFVRALIFAGVMWFALVSFGMYSDGLHSKTEGYQLRYFGAFILGTVLAVLVYYFVPQVFTGRGVLLISVLISGIGSAILRGVLAQPSSLQIFKRRVLVVGSGNNAKEIADLERELGPSARFHIVGFVSLDGEHSHVDAKRLLKQSATLAETCRQYEVEEVVLAADDRRNGRVDMHQLLECKMYGLNIIDYCSFFELATGHLPVNALNTSWIIFSDGFRRDPVRLLAKRVFDMCVSLLLLALMAPLMIVTALAVKLESRGPIFYRQVRVGEYGRTFEIWKFRSMRTDAESDGVARWAQSNDNRVTRVGKFIRLTRIDELPQLFNVLLGDMSFVGPRPERPEFTSQLEKHIPYYSNRHAVRPGITGWAQIRYPYGASVDDARRKLQYDLYYVKNHTLFLDLVVLFQTAQVVLFGKGAR